MSDLILHHYPGSPFGEKISAILGYKGVPWRSVHVPPTLPRPLMAPLTGNHRRTPVLQQGADLYFDTRCIAAFLERCAPTPSLYPPGSRLAADLLTCWAEPRVFVAMAPLRFRGAEDVDGISDGAVDAASFAADRAPFMRGALDVARIAELLPAAWDQVDAFLAVIERGLLASGGPFLCGREPSLADFSAYHITWWLDHRPRVSALLDARPRVVEWLASVRAIGHGRAARLTAEEALEQARVAEPAAVDPGDWRDAMGRKPGGCVRVAADDYGRDVTIGELVAASADEIVVRREDPAVGALHLHFPRIGFQILPA